MSYTPGPWTIDEFGYVVMSDGSTVASGSWHPDVVPLDKDDARLIAAAPDLLEALKRLHETGLVREFNTPENKAALAAIAKAEGR